MTQRESIETIEIRTFSGFIVTCYSNGQPISEINAAVYDVVMYVLLAEHNYRRPRKQLLQYIQAKRGCGLDAANNILSKAVKEYRLLLKRAGDCMELTPVARQRLDCEQFRSLVKVIKQQAQPDVQLCYEALELYQGVFLSPDLCSVYMAGELKDRASMQRRLLAAGYVAVVIRLIRALLQQGYYEETERLVQHGIALHEHYTDLYQECDRMRAALQQHESRMLLFVSREEQAQQLAARIRTERVLVLRGEHKVGKSALLDILCIQCSHKKQYYLRYLLRSDETAITSFHRFYERLIGIEVEPDEKEARMAVTCFQQLEEQHMLLLLENVDALRPDQWSDISLEDNVWQQLFERIKQEGQNSRVILEAAFSSAFKRHLDDHDGESYPNEDWPEWTLYGFTPAEGALFLACQGVTGYAADARERISQSFYGNPALLRWVAAHPTQWNQAVQLAQSAEELQQSARVLCEYLTQDTNTFNRLQVTLTDAARQVLLALALARLPLQDRLLNVLPSACKYDMLHLFWQGFLVDYSDDESYIPAEVRYYVLAQSTLEDYRKAHCLLYRCYGALIQDNADQWQRKRYARERQYHANCYQQRA